MKLRVVVCCVVVSFVVVSFVVCFVFCVVWCARVHTCLCFTPSWQRIPRRS